MVHTQSCFQTVSSSSHMTTRNTFNCSQVAPANSLWQHSVLSNDTIARLCWLVYPQLEPLCPSKMTKNESKGSNNARGRKPWRWGALTLLVLLPALAMRDVKWIAGILKSVMKESKVFLEEPPQTPVNSKRPKDDRNHASEEPSPRRAALVVPINSGVTKERTHESEGPSQIVSSNNTSVTDESAYEPSEEPRDPRLPQWPTERISKPTDRILVVYSGPTEMPLKYERLLRSGPAERKKELYRLNFEHFLKYGVQCKTQDTLLIVTSQVEPHYREQVDAMNQKCQSEHGNQVLLAIRNNTCLDLETARRAIHDDLVNISSYDYFVCKYASSIFLSLACSLIFYYQIITYLSNSRLTELLSCFTDANCGTTGPSKVWANLPWTDVFIAKLNDRVKMTGLTMNCRGPSHIQSMVYAVDRVGLNIIRRSRCVFDCKKRPPKNNRTPESSHIISNYERCLSFVILQGRFGISPLIRPTVLFKANSTKCAMAYPDMWITKVMEKHFGRVLDLEDTVFFKTSRLMSNKTAKEINLTIPVTWSW